MKERKVRQKGFLALLLAAVIVLGMPGMNVLAANYSGYSSPLTGTTIHTNDVIYATGDVTLVIKQGSNIIFNQDQMDWIVPSQYDGCEIISHTYTTITRGGYDWYIYEITLSGGDSSDSNTPAEGYYRSLKDLIGAINIKGGDTHGYGIGTALPYSVMKALENNPEDTLVFKCEFKGNRYTFTILGADVKGKISPEIPWYGPYWLAQNFYTTTVIEPLEPVTPAT